MLYVSGGQFYLFFLKKKILYIPGGQFYLFLKKRKYRPRAVDLKPDHFLKKKCFIYPVVNFTCFFKKEKIDQEMYFKLLIFKKWCFFKVFF